MSPVYNRYSDFSINIIWAVMSDNNEIFPRRDNDTIVLSMAQLELLKKQLVEETKEAVKEEFFLDLGRITFENGKTIIFKAVQVVGLVAIFAAYYLHSKGILSEFKL